MHQSPNLDQPQALARSQRHSGGVFVARLVQLVALGLSLALIAVALPGCIDERTPPKTHSAEQGRSFGGARPTSVDGGSVDLGNQMGAPWTGGLVSLPSPVSPNGEPVSEKRTSRKGDNREPVLRDEGEYCFLKICSDHAWLPVLTEFAVFFTAGILFGLTTPGLGTLPAVLFLLAAATAWAFLPPAI